MKITLALILAGLTFSIMAVICRQNNLEFAPIKTRAHEVFEFDRQNPDYLPAGKVRALSMTIGFHDKEGALKILNQIERAVKNHSSDI